MVERQQRNAGQDFIILGNGQRRQGVAEVPVAGALIVLSLYWYIHTYMLCLYSRQCMACHGD
jgi:hypothetical protein